MFYVAYSLRFRKHLRILCVSPKKSTQDAKQQFFTWWILPVRHQITLFSSRLLHSQGCFCRINLCPFFQLSSHHSILQNCPQSAFSNFLLFPYPKRFSIQKWKRFLLGFKALQKPKRPLIVKTVSSCFIPFSLRGKSPSTHIKALLKVGASFMSCFPTLQQPSPDPIPNSAHFPPTAVKLPSAPSGQHPYPAALSSPTPGTTLGSTQALNTNKLQRILKIY